jgi:glycyl-tRNA synthetase
MRRNREGIYERLMSLCKRRGFIYPSFEIYGGVAGFYDYGPLGSQLKNNIENIWRRLFIIQEGCLEIDTPTVTLYEVLKASGHVDEFTDLVVGCRKCGRSFKVEEMDREEKRCPSCGGELGDPHEINLMFSTTVGEEREGFLRPETAQGIFTNFHLLYRYNREKLPFGVVQIGRGYRNEISPRQGIIRLREFSMAEAEIFFDPENKSHPRFEEVKDREILLFDNREEFKIKLKDAVKKEIINNEALAYYMYLTQRFLLTVGIDSRKLRFRKHSSDELAHYAMECWDAEAYSERFGWIECVGIADRSAYDLKAHIKASGIDMYALRKYDKPKEIVRIVPNMSALGPIFKDKTDRVKALLENVRDERVVIELDGKKIEVPKNCYKVVHEKKTYEKFIPHVIEPSYGIDRIIYCVLEHGYHETEKRGEKYRILRLKPWVAPVKVGVFPLVSDDRLISIARSIDKKLRNSGIATYYDEGGTIGRRYARMDEIGTPFCITVDRQTLEDGTVTVRDRDTTKQERKKEEELFGYLKKCLEGFIQDT